jgi:hypothetical protein
MDCIMVVAVPSAVESIEIMHSRWQKRSQSRERRTNVLVDQLISFGQTYSMHLLGHC